jgi:hypothetical protein
MKTHPLDTGRVQLPASINEKIALVKLRKGSYSDTESGQWIGARHLVVYLTANDYATLLEIIDGDTREQSQKESKGNTERV